MEGRGGALEAQLGLKGVLKRLLGSFLIFVEKVLRKLFLVFSLFLKSKVILSFGFGFSMSENPHGTNSQPYWAEVCHN